MSIHFSLVIKEFLALRKYYAITHIKILSLVYNYINSEILGTRHFLAGFFVKKIN